MVQFDNVMQVFALLNKSNCRKCGEKTCMAFAAEVFLGKKPLNDCPDLQTGTVEQYCQPERRDSLYQEDLENGIAQLTQELHSFDLEVRAKKIGASYRDGFLVLKIMGKDFGVDAQGNIITDLHLNSWVLISALNYIVHSKGTEVMRQWVPLRELPGGKDWYRLFGQQCEKPLKKLADSYPDLFEDLVTIFAGAQVEDRFDSDIGVVLWPLPLVPMLYCYWRPEEGMTSHFSLFFDRSAEDNLGIHGLHMLGSGITKMFEQIARQHGNINTPL